MGNDFSAGPRLSDDPTGDPKRQAIASLRGYAYQLYASALAWVDLRQGQQLYLEVAEDYATLANQVLRGVQVKDTAPSGAITINTDDVRQAIDAFVDLCERNPNVTVTLRYLTTSEIGTERSLDYRIAGESVLTYWGRAAVSAEVAPLRAALLKADLSVRVRTFIEARSDEELREHLLKRIQWDCGRPELGAIKADLDALLVEFGSERFQLAPSECFALPSAVLTKIFDTVVGPVPRRLVGADLLKLCEQHTRMSVSKVAFNNVIQRLSEQPAGIFFSGTPMQSLLEAEAELPLPGDLALRKDLVNFASGKLLNERILFFTGGTGVGKTIVARLVARSTGKPWYVLDVRNTTASECARRLQSVLVQISDTLPGGLILDDLSVADNHATAQALLRLTRSLRRQGVFCLVTTYRTPPGELLDQLGAGPEAVIPVPHLDESEVGNLVEAAGGNQDVWKRPVYMYGGMGHPQLVRAVLAGLRARGWPRTELAALSSAAGSNPDVEAARSAVRRRLAEVLQDEPRRLLYRVSLLIGRFSRSLAVHLATIAPQLDVPGERLDILVGPWIDDLSNGQLRNSPLVANVGRDTLAPDEQVSVRRVAVQQLTSGNDLDVRQADAVFVYALEGRLQSELLKFSMAVIASRARECRRLAAWLPSLRGMSTDFEVFPESPILSVALRLAQLLLVAQTNDACGVRSVWHALERLLHQTRQRPFDSNLEYIALFKVLISTSLAGVLPNWFGALRRLDELAESSRELRSIVDNVESSAPQKNDGKVSLIGNLFILHATNAQTVNDQVQLFNALDLLDRPSRERYLGEASQMPSDYALLVNASWLSEVKNESLDWSGAAASYAVMASQAGRWGYPQLALRCYVAQSIMLDDYGAQEQAALDVLARAEQETGPDPVISRARAKIHFRHRRHEDALASFAEEAVGFAQGDPVERAYLCREMGISAAETGNWTSATVWFGRSREAASKTLSKTMRPMEIGLHADEALAAYRGGATARAVSMYGEVLELLGTLDGDASTKGEYCKRVVRHGLLWLFGQTTGHALEVDGTPPVMVPGMCSNPEPPESIRSLQCASMDVAWHLQAAIEGRHLGVATANANLAQRLNGKAVPALEITTRHELVASALAHMDVDGFMGQFRPWTASLAYLAEHSEELRKGDLVHPTYGTVPPAGVAQLDTPPIQRQIEDAILTFGMFAAMNRRRDALQELCRLLVGKSGTDAGRELIAVMLNDGGAVEDVCIFVCRAVHTVITHDALTPDQLFGVTVRFVQAVRQSSFSTVVLRAFVPWARAAWHRAIENRFSIRNPKITIPLIEAALLVDSLELATVADILLAAEGAVSVRMASELREMLRLLAKGACLDAAPVV
ncbi:AAA family ATPase [Burkholderia metallica]|uniref:AAA family ATPase n=1 Tax=Burkholderia metallica TaxID=488729 RepID=UPI000D1A83BA|nr:AAA family ATPase [Burkholderia metallica]